MAAGFVHQSAVLAVLVGHRAEQTLPHDVGKAHDGVERRAKLMAHVGQEAGLAAGQRLGVDLRLFEGRLAGVVGGGVADDGQDHVVLGPAEGDSDPAILGRERSEGDLGSPVRGGGLQGGGDRLALRRQGRQAHADQAGGVDPFRRPPVDRPHLAMGIQRDEEVRLVRQQAGQSLSLAVLSLSDLAGAAAGQQQARAQGHADHRHAQQAQRHGHRRAGRRQRDAQKLAGGGDSSGGDRKQSPGHGQPVLAHHQRYGQRTEAQDAQRPADPAGQQGPQHSGGGRQSEQQQGIGARGLARLGLSVGNVIGRIVGQRP